MVKNTQLDNVSAVGDIKHTKVRLKLDARRDLR